MWENKCLRMAKKYLKESISPDIKVYYNATRGQQYSVGIGLLS